MATNNAINAPPEIVCGGRLTLTSGLPVTTADVTAATTVYFSPYKSNLISIYNGTYWITIPFAETSIVVPSTTSTMYDLYGQISGGALALVAVAWTNDTTRATGISLQNGVYCETGTLTNRYLGSFRTTGSSGQTEDSILKRYVWNYYNRAIRPMSRVDATASWTYSTAAFRQANGSTSNQIDAIVGVLEDEIYIQASSLVSNSTTAAEGCSVGIGLSSTTVNSAIVFDQLVCTTVAIPSGKAVYNTFPSTVGRYFYVWLEYGAGTLTQTWSGTGTLNKFGIFGYLWG